MAGAVTGVVPAAMAVSIAGLYSPNGSGPYQSSGSFKPMGISSYPLVAPESSSSPSFTGSVVPVVADTAGSDDDMVPSGLLSVCVAGGSVRMGALSLFSLRMVSDKVDGSAPVAVLSACDDSGSPCSFRNAIRVMTSLLSTGETITASTMRS